MRALLLLVPVGIGFVPFLEKIAVTVYAMVVDGQLVFRIKADPPTAAFRITILLFGDLCAMVRFCHGLFRYPFLLGDGQG